MHASLPWSQPVLMSMQKHKSVSQTTPISLLALAVTLKPGHMLSSWFSGT